MNTRQLKEFLDRKVDEFDQPSFITTDPISIPHAFTSQQDIEIAGFFAAVFAWGTRTGIIAKCRDLLQRMDNAPFDFIQYHEERHLKQLLGFKHRTFNDTDLLYFVSFLQHHYKKSATLETAFSQWLQPADEHIEKALNGFYQYFFSLEHVPDRTRKHIASPGKKSTCKRLNMFLRWMVRNDGRGVDFGVWRQIKPAQLVCPIDLHVARVARRFQLLQRQQTDWQAALDLTACLRKLEPSDPVKYDFALFGLGIMEKF
ncbi:MAG TPA: TIGR02757 family protein [Chitinophagaceae bacterium]|nr:TIGR02757 family protein [Chitinophagaceae bacterium]